MSGLDPFRVSFEISPIILTGGLAQNVTGGIIPIISLLQPGNYDLGLLSQAGDKTLDQFLAHFTVQPGGSLMDNAIGKYPFANQGIAANAIITQPLTVSLRMSAPARANDSANNYSAKLATFTALRASLNQHTALGGSYIVATPAYIYRNCLLTSLRDDTSYEAGGQVQVEWTWAFEQPLITDEQIQAVANQAMAKIASQTQVSGDPPTSSTPSNAVGQPSSNVGQSVIPAARAPAGASVVGSVYYGVSTQGGPNPTPSTAAGGPGSFIPRVP